MFTNTKDMKRFFYLSLTILFCFSFVVSIPKTYSTVSANNEKPKLCIIIDDFGSFDQSGVETMLSIDAPITCAVMPNVDNTTLNIKQIQNANKEVILHMPMEADVSLPKHWYGIDYISTCESKDNIYKKLNNAFSSVNNAKGFNIHIGSGVCQNKDIINHIYNYATEHNLFFIDSRTHINTICDKVANEKNIVYLGRDEFLEPDGDRSYDGVKRHLLIGANLAKEKGYAIVIGHVGVHGGENTANAIKDTVSHIKNLGIDIVFASELNDFLQNKSTT